MILQFTHMGVKQLHGFFAFSFYFYLSSQQKRIFLFFLL